MAYLTLPVPVIQKYSSVGNLPSSAANGALAETLDTHSLYVYDSTLPGWVLIAGPGLASGITSINADATPAQLLSIGSAGSNFALVDAGGGSHVFNLPIASAVNTGKLSNTDWSTFNSKQSAGSYITALTGEVSATGPGSVAATLSNAAVIAKVLTSYLSGPGTITSADSIISAIEKLNGNTAAIIASEGSANGIATLDGSGKVPFAQLPSSIMIYLGAWDASINSPLLADGTGVNGDTYRTSVAGTQNLGSGPQTFFVGDFVIYNGSIWQRSPAADGVTSVNGFTGAVTLTTTNITEGTNLYFTNARARSALSVDGGADPLAYNSGTGQFSMPASSGSQNGYLTSTDWSTFNSKQAAGNYITALTGDISASGPGSVSSTVNSVGGSSAASINTVVVNTTGVNSGDITISDTASIDLTLVGQLLSAVVLPAGVDHNSLANLATGDVHTQYALLAGRSGGQTLIGGTAASNNLILNSTSNATKGQVYINEVTDSTSISTGALRIDGGVGIAKSLFVGTQQSMGPNGSTLVTNKLFDQSTAGTPNIVIQNSSTSAVGQPRFAFYKTRGSVASPTIVANNDTIGNLSFAAYDGAAQQFPTTILANVNGTPSAGVIPTRLVFNCTNSTGTRYEIIRFDGSGFVKLFGNGTNGTPHLLWNTNGIGDIGATGANSPRDLWLDRDAHIQGTISGGSTVLASSYVQAVGGGTATTATFLDGASGNSGLGFSGGSSLDLFLGGTSMINIDAGTGNWLFQSALGTTFQTFNSFTLQVDATTVLNATILDVNINKPTIFSTTASATTALISQLHRGNDVNAGNTIPTTTIFRGGDQNSGTTARAGHLILRGGDQPNLGSSGFGGNITLTPGNGNQGGYIMMQSFQSGVFNDSFKVDQNYNIYALGATNALSGKFAIGDNLNVYLQREGTNTLLLSATSETYFQKSGITQWKLLTTGDLAGQIEGSGLSIKEGSNAKQGVATLVLGSVVVSNTTVTANSRIFLTAQSLGTVGVPQALAVTSRTPGVSFTITSVAVNDTSIVAYEIFEPS